MTYHLNVAPNGRLVLPADVRKRLLKAAQSVATAATPEENLLIGQWLDSRHSQVLPGDSYHAASEGEDPDFG